MALYDARRRFDAGLPGDRRPCTGPPAPNTPDLDKTRPRLPPTPALDTAKKTGTAAPQVGNRALPKIA